MYNDYRAVKHRPARTETTINETWDYDQFQHAPGQRAVDSRRVAQLAESMRVNNYLHSYPIVVNEDMEILDGQHRFEAARSIGAKIYYVINDNIKPLDVAGMAGLTAGWRLEDFMNSFADQGLPDYIALREFTRTHEGFTAAVCVLLCGNNLAKFKRGQLSFDRAYVEQIAKHAADFAPFFKWHTRKTFLYAIRYLMDHPDYDHDHMMEKAARQVAKFGPRVNVADYVQMLEEIYNQHARKYVHFLPMKKLQKRAGK